MPILYNPATGEVQDFPRSNNSIPAIAAREEKEAISIIKSTGPWVTAEPLVDTRSGGLVHISVEPQVQSGRGFQISLAAKRPDKGHHDDPAFMTPAAWARLPQAEKNRLMDIKPEPEAKPEPKAEAKR